MPVDKREYSIRELVESEKRYVEALGMIKTKFIRPLSTVLNQDEKKIIFYGIEVFLEFVMCGKVCNLITIPLFARNCMKYIQGCTVI